MDVDIIKLDFYGYKIQVYCPDAELAKRVGLDFSYFKSNAPERDLKIEVVRQDKRAEDMGEMPAAFSTPRNVCYYKDGISYIDYFGKALAIYDRDKKEIKIFSQDINMAHEAVYLSILSLAGQYLDSRAYHRVHGVGLDAGGKAVVIMLDSGSGKTELALKVLRSGEPYKLISEDTPIITRKAKVLPFPLRIGVINQETVHDVPAEAKIYAPRMEFGPKYLVDAMYFKDKISGKPSSLWLLITGVRSTRNEPAIYPISKFAIFSSIFKNYIMGLGVYQGMEFMLRKSPFDLFKKAGTVFSRSVNTLSLILRSRTFRLILSKDRDKNYEFLIDFLKKQEAKAKK